MDKKSFSYAYGVYGAVGIQLAVAIVGGIWLGLFIDRKLETFPVFLLVGLLLGTVAGFYQLFKLIKKKKEGDDD